MDLHTRSVQHHSRSPGRGTYLDAILWWSVLSQIFDRYIRQWLLTDSVGSAETAVPPPNQLDLEHP